MQGVGFEPTSSSAADLKAAGLTTFLSLLVYCRGESLNKN